MSTKVKGRRPVIERRLALAALLCLTTLPAFGQEASLQPPANLRVALETGEPYQHVGAADVGLTVGVGVTAPIPTQLWTASTMISVPGTVIENVVVNGCLDVYADNVTIRNVIVNCASLYPIDIRARNAVIENSKVDCTSSSKAFMLKDPVNARILRNEIKGCQDFFFIDGNVDGLLVEDNFMHSVIGTSASHADGFQIGESADTYGTMSIRGNYIWKNNPDIGATDIVFVTDYSRHTLWVENNFFHPWGAFTLRCTDAATCIGRNNVYSLEFLDADNLSRTSPYGFDEFTCNRYEDGAFLDSNVGDTTSCPAFAN